MVGIISISAKVGLSVSQPSAGREGGGAPVQPSDSTILWHLLVTKFICSSRAPPIPPGGTAAAQGSLQPLLFACRLREHSEREQSMQAELERQERKKLLIARERLAFHRHRLERERMERERLERERRRVEHERRREQERIHHEREELRRQQELRYEQERRPAVRRPYDYGR